MFEAIEPRHTTIVSVIEVNTGRAILEDHARYPLSDSNLYFVSRDGEAVWEAERPAPDAHFIRVRLNDDGRSLSAYTTGRQACEIDLKSGKLLSQLEFK
jgi:hypothetical protein